MQNIDSQQIATTGNLNLYAQPAPLIVPFGPINTTDRDFRPSTYRSEPSVYALPDLTGSIRVTALLDQKLEAGHRIHDLGEEVDQPQPFDLRLEAIVVLAFSYPRHGST